MMHATVLHARFACAIVLALWCVLPRAVAAQTVEGTEQSRQELIDALATKLADQKTSAGLSAQQDRLFAFAVMRGVAESFRPVAEAKVETARTDKQPGSSGGGGSAAAERAGFARLLALAIERGALQQERGKSTYTLSTTPYAGFALVRGDTADTYRRYGPLSRVGLSATFKIGEQEDDVLGAVASDNFTEATLKFQLHGDRSARSKQFSDYWRAEVRPLISQRLARITGGLSAVTATVAGIERLRAFRERLQASADEALKGTPTKASVQQAIETALDEVSAEVADGRFALDPETRALFVALPQELEALDAAVRERVRLGEAQFLSTEGRSLATAIYSFQKPETAEDSNASVLKLVFERKMTVGTSIVANVAAAMYHDPDPAKKQERLRDVTLVASLERTMGVKTALPKADAGTPSLSLSVRFQHTPENDGVEGKDKQIGIFQGLLQVPFGAGLSVPISVSWQTGSRFTAKGHMVGQLGFAVDADKLAAVAAALAPRVR